MSRRLARPVAVTFGLTALTLGYLLWVLEVDGLHTQPPTLLPTLLKAPLWTLLPAAVAGLLGYAVGTLDERPGPPSSFEFKLLFGFAIPTFLVATVALGQMFFGYETKAAGAPTTLLALGRYPDVLLALSATAGAYGHLFGLGWRSLGGAGDDTPGRDVETAPSPGESPARDPTRGRRGGVARAGGAVRFDAAGATGGRMAAVGSPEPGGRSDSTPRARPVAGWPRPRRRPTTGGEHPERPGQPTGRPWAARPATRHRRTGRGRVGTGTPTRWASTRGPPPSLEHRR